MRSAIGVVAWWWVVQLLACSADGASSSCPCSSPVLCEAVSGPPARGKEIYGFVASNTSLDWSRISTIAWDWDDALMCEAHSNGVRVVLAVSPPITANLTSRTAFVQDTLANIETRHADGVVFDFESPLPVGSPNARWYAEIIGQTTEALHALNPSLQTTTCVAWSPDNIDGRGYDIPALAAASDLLYVMDYDTRSQVLDVCVASANAPLAGTVRGLQRYLDLGVDPQKLVLGVPWYGYRYECLPGTAPNATICPIPLVPFRGVNCSDAAGSEVAYKDILRIQREHGATAHWDDSTSSVFFNTVENGSTIQYWYDNPASLRLKYAHAAEIGLRGVGPFTYSDAELSGDFAVEGKAMFEALDAFLLSSSPKVDDREVVPPRS